MIRGLPLFDQKRNDLILLTQLPFGHVDSDSGIPKLFPILSVRKPGIVIVFMGNRIMIDLLCAAIADIRSFVQSAATFFFKVFAGLVTGWTGSTFHTTKDNHPAYIRLSAMITMNTEVISIVKSTFVVPVRQSVSFYLF